MSGLDTLIAQTFGNTLKTILGEKILYKVQDRLFEKYGITVSEATKDFQKLDSILKELFGSKTDVIERQIMRKIVILEESKRKDRNWITIEDMALAKVILESIGDYDKKNILNTVLDEPRIISDILNVSSIPQTSGYRKINALIHDGMLIPYGMVSMYDGKKVTKYKSVFESIVIKIEKNKVTIRVLPTIEAMEKSTIMKLVGSRFQYDNIHCM
ncbi:MAG TPA: transcriptional regulator [Candidatus Nitrosotalea sp.]|nr:transcriptional regulator [Nitrososphaerota archaeon]HKU32693.1 transcriptional regulator [Candidatus Nitrosotalea sp.]